jgi:hypothetical protein
MVSETGLAYMTRKERKEYFGISRIVYGYLVTARLFHRR